MLFISKRTFFVQEKDLSCSWIGGLKTLEFEVIAQTLFVAKGNPLPLLAVVSDALSVFAIAVSSDLGVNTCENLKETHLI